MHYLKSQNNGIGAVLLLTLCSGMRVNVLLFGAKMYGLFLLIKGPVQFAEDHNETRGQIVNRALETEVAKEVVMNHLTLRVKH